MMEFVCVGEIVKAIGLKGELKLYPLLDYFDELLDSPYAVWQDGSEVRVKNHRQAGSCVAIKVPGVDNRTQADNMIGRELGFLKASYTQPDFPIPAGGLAFRYVGRDVRTADGTLVGTVDEVRSAAGQHLLVIPDGDGEMLIPVVEPICVVADDSLEGDLTIDPPEGLLDVHTG